MHATLALALALQSTLTVEPIVDATDGLDNAIGIASIPGDDRLFIVEIGGLVKILRADQLDPVPLLDVRARVQGTFFTGLRAIAFHPDHRANGHVYLWLDAPSTSGALVDIVLARMTLSPVDPDQVAPSSFVEILREPQQNLGHACGDLGFGPDGMLYAILGDGGEQGDPACNAQRGSSLMGSMIRIDVDGGSSYAIPADNPFIGDPSVRDETWHLGLRHPWKWSFDRLNGDLWIADVGQDRIEEVNFVPAGNGGWNFGWKVMEGPLCYQNSNCPAGTPPCGDPAYTLPIHWYEHDLGCSITGGYVYRGVELVDRWGEYYFADYCSGRIWSLRHDSGQAIDLVERTAEFDPGSGRSITAPVTFGEDGFGEMWLIDADGWELFRVRRNEEVIAFCDASPNATGVPGEMGLVSGGSLSSGALTVEASSLPVGEFGLFFFGMRSARRRLGSGVLCIDPEGMNLARLPVVSVDSSGRAITTIDHASPIWLAANIGPGATRQFQFWHREPGGGSNLTNAISIRFMP